MQCYILIVEKVTDLRLTPVEHRDLSEKVEWQKKK